MLFFRLKLSLLIAASFAPPLLAADKPNIVIILADDLGYGDAGAYNPRAKTRTPNIDGLAAAGMRFLDGHSGDAVCTPSRYGLLTGRYCWRTSLKAGVLGPASPALIADNCDTLASLLKRNGYSTAAIGKWHLGLGSPGTLAQKLTTAPAGLTPGPNQRGFDYSYILTVSLNEGPYVFLKNLIPVNALDDTPSPPYATWRATKGGGHYPEPLGFNPGRIAPGFDPQFDADPARDCRFNKVPPRLTTEAVSFINRRASQKTAQPFFLYFALPSPHTPWVPDIDTTGFTDEQLYMAYVDQTDSAIGSVLAALKKNGFWDDTLVIFSSDNGPELRRFNVAKAGHNPAGSLRGEKSDLYEGGHREPFIVTWPGHIQPRTTSNQLICTIDFYRTFATLVHDTTRPAGMIGGEDSVDFSGLFLGRKVDHPIRANLVNHSVAGRFAVRLGGWKYLDRPGSGGYLSPDKNPEGTPAQLFNLATDPSEKVNLYSSEPKRVSQMKALLMQIQGIDAPKVPLAGMPEHDDTKD